MCQKNLHEYTMSLYEMKYEMAVNFYETTAGMLALIRPCGIVVNMVEMLSESLRGASSHKMSNFEKILKKN